VCIFDEPLSAVDAHVAKWLFDNVLGPEGILKHTTRLVVTHRVQFALEADMIMVFNAGEIQAVGTYNGELSWKKKSNESFFFFFVAGSR
jgi:ABC-type multidrug transport system fused ATPase/permease subunit